MLITGGAGFIGSNLIKLILQTMQYKVICFDNFDGFYDKTIKINNVSRYLNDENFRLIEGDVLNRDHLEKIPEVDIIIHLAAKTGVRPSLYDAKSYYQVNTIGTQTLLEFARDRSIRKFIFTSSRSVYGMNDELPWCETATPLPISPYAGSKAAAEIIGLTYSNLYDIQFLALRLFTVYGPGQRPDLAIQRFFTSILNNRPIQIFGDGHSKRDYTYIDDITNAIQKSINFSTSKYEIFNIGSQNPVSLKELINAIEIVCNKKAMIETLPAQMGDVSITYADITKAEKLLNFIPNHSLLKGLTKHYRWMIATNNFNSSPS